MPTYGFVSKNAADEYLITDQTTNLTFVKRILSPNYSTSTSPRAGFGGFTLFNYTVSNCAGVPVPFFTAPISGKAYSVTQVYPTGIDNQWNVEVICNTRPEDQAAFVPPLTVTTPAQGFDMTLERLFVPEEWETPIWPNTSSATGKIGQVQTIPAGYSPATGADGLTRGSYVLCSDYATYDTTTNSTTRAFEQEHIPQGRRVKFSNILRSGEYLAWKAETSGVSNPYAAFQFNGGDVGGVPGTSSQARTTSLTPSFNSVGVAHAAGYVHRIHEKKRAGMSYTNPIIATGSNASDYINGYTRLYISQWSYENIEVGQYANWASSSDPIWGTQFINWREITHLGYNATDGYYLQVLGNYPCVNYDDVCYDYASQDAEDITIGGTESAQFFFYVRGWPSVSATLVGNPTYNFTLNSAYTKSNIDFFPIPLDNSESQRHELRLQSGAPTFPEFFPNHLDSNLTVGPTDNPTSYVHYGNTTNYNPSFGYNPWAFSDNGDTELGRPTTQHTFILRAGLSGKTHYFENDMDINVLLKGDSSYHVLRTAPETALRPLDDVNNATTNLSTTQLSKLQVKGFTSDSITFNQSVSFGDTTGASTSVGIFYQGGYFNIPHSTSFDGSGGLIRVWHENAYLTYNHGVTGSLLSNGQYSLKSINITDSSGTVYTTPFTAGTWSTAVNQSPELAVMAEHSNYSSSAYATLPEILYLNYTVYIKALDGTSSEIVMSQTIRNAKPTSTEPHARLHTNIGVCRLTQLTTYPKTEAKSPPSGVTINVKTENITGAIRTFDLKVNNSVVKTITSSLDDLDISFDPWDTTPSTVYKTIIDTILTHKKVNLDVTISQSGSLITTASAFLHLIRTPGSSVRLIKHEGNKSYHNVQDPSLWRHAGFKTTPDTIQTHKRSFTPGVACIRGVIDNIHGMNIQPYYMAEGALQDSGTFSVASAFADSTTYQNLPSHENTGLLSFHPLYLQATGGNLTTKYSYSSSSSNKWDYSYVSSGGGTTHTEPYQVSLTSTARGLLRANYGYLTSTGTTKERLIWNGSYIASSSTIGGIANGSVYGGYTYEFDFDNTVYTEHFSFVPVKRTGPYTVADNGDFDVNAYNTGGSPELYIFSEPPAAPTPHDDYGVQILSPQGVPVFDSRSRPLIITDTANISHPTDPVTPSCGSLKGNSWGGNFQSHSSEFTPTGSSTISLTTTATPAFLYNTKVQSHRECVRTETETESDTLGLTSRTYYHTTKYWALYKGGIARTDSNTSSIAAKYITVERGAYYQVRKVNSYIFGAVTGGISSGEHGIMPWNNETINNITDTVISIDASLYTGPTFTVTTNVFNGDIRLSGTDRNGTFANAVRRTLNLRTGDRLKITFSEANMSIKSAFTSLASDNILKEESINNVGTANSQVTWCPHTPGTYYYTTTGGSINTLKSGSINITTS